MDKDMKRQTKRAFHKFENELDNFINDNAVITSYHLRKSLAEVNMKRQSVYVLVMVFVLTITGCGSSNRAEEQMDTEQDHIEMIEEQYIVEEDLQDSVQAFLVQERIIQDQSFTIELNDWGSVEFVSYEPERGIDLKDVSFYLVKDDQVIYEFPYYCEDNNSYFGLFYNVEAVGFRDLNNDGRDDIIIIISYIPPGAGLEGAVPRSHARIFLAENKGFYVAEDMMDEISDHIAGEDLSVDNVYQYILNKDAEDSTTEVYETGDEIERIREYMIPEQSFDVSLNDWGEVTFVSCMPMPDSNGYTDPHADVSFYLVSGEQIIYRFPYVNYREGTIEPPGVSFVMFMDVDEDGKDDVVIGILYFGVGYMQQNDPLMEIRVYIDNGDEFVHDKSQFDESGGLDYDTTAEEVKAMLKK